jgi:hypothetical protein
MLRIVVDSIEAKDDLLKESKYVHDKGTTLDSDECNTLMHLHVVPDVIVIEEEIKESRIISDLRGQVSFHKGEQERWRKLYQETHHGEPFKDLQKRYADRNVEISRLNLQLKKANQTIEALNREKIESLEFASEQSIRAGIAEEKVKKVEGALSE